MAPKKQTTAEESRRTTVASFIGPIKTIEALFVDVGALLEWVQASASSILAHSHISMREVVIAPKKLRVAQESRWTTVASFVGLTSHERIEALFVDVTAVE
jgi:hypothetical protein